MFRNILNMLESTINNINLDTNESNSATENNTTTENTQNNRRNVNNIFNSFLGKNLFGESNKANKCKKDDFPEPDGPTKALKFPCLIFMFTLSNNSTLPFLCSYFFFRFIVSNRILVIF